MDPGLVPTPPALPVLAQISGEACAGPAIHVGRFSVDYPFLVNVALTAATLAVTCVGVAVGIAAIVGYQSAKRTIRKKSEALAKQMTDNYLKSESFKKVLMKAADDLLQEKLQKELVMSWQPARRGGGKEPSAELKGD